MYILYGEKFELISQNYVINLEKLLCSGFSFWAPSGIASWGQKNKLETFF
jgi:hypothetical protein